MRAIIATLIILSMLGCKKDDKTNPPTYPPCVLKNYKIEYSFTATEAVPHLYHVKYSSANGVDTEDYTEVGYVNAPWSYIDDIGELCKCGTGTDGGKGGTLLFKVSLKDKATNTDTLVYITAKIKVNDKVVWEGGDSTRIWPGVGEFRCK